MSQTLAWVKDSYKVQNRSVDFIITWCKKFVDTILGSTLQLTFLRLCSIKKEFSQLPKFFEKEKLLKYYSFQPSMCIAPGFVTIIMY